MEKTNIVIIVSWRDIFTNYKESKEILDYLKGIDPYFLLLTIYNLNKKQYDDEINFLNILSNNEKYKYFVEINEIIRNLSLSNNNVAPNTFETRKIFNTKTNNYLIKLIVENYNYLERNKITNFESFPFILAYLIGNMELFPNEGFGKDIPKKYFKSLGQFILTTKTYDLNYEYHHLFIFFRIRCLFQYLSENYEFFIEKFINSLDITDLDSHIFNQLDFLSHIEKYSYIKFAEKRNKFEDEIKNYCDSLCINSAIDSSKVELKYFPLLKDREDNGYYLLSKPYILMNFYHSVKYKSFDFIKKEFKPKISYNNFFSEFAEKGSEQILFRNLIKFCLKNKYYQIIMNDKDKSLVDFIICNNKHVFIFEFKDYESNNGLDLFYDYETINNKLDEILINKKGISQLIKTINKLRNNDEFITALKKNKIKLSNVEVYPVLVFSNSFYNIPSLEHFLDLKMKEKLINEEIVFKKIHRLSLIDVNSLFELSYYNQQFEIIKCLKEYVIKNEKFNDNVRFPNYPSFRESFVKNSFVKNSDLITKFVKLTNFNKNESIELMPNNFFEILNKTT